MLVSEPDPRLLSNLTHDPHGILLVLVKPKLCFFCVNCHKSFHLGMNEHFTTKDATTHCIFCSPDVFKSLSMFSFHS